VSVFLFFRDNSQHLEGEGGVQAARQVGFHSTQGGGPASEYQYCCDWCPVESKATAEPGKIYENDDKTVKLAATGCTTGSTQMFSVNFHKVQGLFFLSFDQV
jgi:hypothetical protein